MLFFSIWDKQYNFTKFNFLGLLLTLWFVEVDILP